MAQAQKPGLGTSSDPPADGDRRSPRPSRVNRGGPSMTGPVSRAALVRRGSPIAALTAYLAVSLASGALLAFPVHAALRRAGADVAFDSVLQRVVALVLLLLLPLYLVRADATHPAALGFGGSPRRLARGFVTGFALGIVIVSPLVLAFLLLGIRAPTIAGTPADFGLYLAGALAAASLIGLVEEAYFRGALLAPLDALPAWGSIALVSLVYAGVHFIGAPIATDPGWLSGFASLGRSEAPLDAFLALLAAGVLLGAMRYRFGHVALGAGFHAGWVWIMKLNQEYSDVRPGSDLLFLEGSFGGTMGYLGLAWIALVGAGWAVWERFRPARRRAAAARA